MRFRTLIALAALTLIAAAPAQAAVGQHEFGFEGGLSVPTGDFGDAAGNGFNIGAEYQYMVANLGVGAEVKYHGWGATDEANSAAALAFGNGSELSYSAWQYDAFGVWAYPLPSVSPYVKIGAGWYSPGSKLDSPSGSTDSRDTNFGVSAGLGVDWSLPTGTRLGVNGTYHRLKDTNADFFSFGARVMWPLKMGL